MPAPPSVPSPQSTRWRPWFLAAPLGGGLLALMAVLQYQTFGRSSTERMLTEMALPMGLVWLLVSFLLLLGLVRSLLPSVKRGAYVRRDRVWGLMALWLLVTLAGNRSLARHALLATEFPTVPAESAAQDGRALDLLVVLGGGVSADAEGRPRLSDDGDRIRPMIQLWRAGSAKRLVVTGSASGQQGASPAELSRQLLISFGIPGGEIEMIEGDNTNEEMRNLRVLVDRWREEHQREPRLGVITSAFHLPRAMRLAAAHGLRPRPIPTVRRSGSGDPLGWARAIVPTSSALNDLSRCWKEWMAAVVRR